MTHDLMKRIPFLRLTAVVAFGAVIGSVVLAKATWGETGRPGIATPLAFMVLFVATITLLAIVIVMCQRLVDEMDAQHPLRVRKRGVVLRGIKALLRGSFALAARASRAWLDWVTSVFVLLRREVTREAVEQWAHDTVIAFSGVPPAGVSPPRYAGRLARPDPSQEPKPTRTRTHHRRPARSGESLRSPLTTLARLVDEARRRNERVRT
jgi:hypothetical protein